jgi:hypothetical protein
MALTMKSTFFWVVMLCSVERHQCFGGTYCLHLRSPKSAKQETSSQQAKFAMKMEAATSSNCWALYELHGVTTQKTVIFCMNKSVPVHTHTKAEFHVSPLCSTKVSRSWLISTWGHMKEVMYQWKWTQEMDYFHDFRCCKMLK